jgi:hypothetical protein
MPILKQDPRIYSMPVPPPSVKKQMAQWDAQMGTNLPLHRYIKKPEPNLKWSTYNAMSTVMDPGELVTEKYRRDSEKNPLNDLLESYPTPTDAISKKMQEESGYTTDRRFDLYDKYQTKIGVNGLYPITQPGSFTLKDIEDGKPGIRHGAAISKGILNDLVKAAAREGVPLLDALATGMRETGLGSYAQTKKEVDQIEQYDPWAVMMSHNAKLASGQPMSPDAFRLKRGTVPKHLINRGDLGIDIKVGGWGDTNARKDLDDYEKYLDEFQVDPTLTNEPFRRDMRFLKENLGQKYNPNEKDRIAKLEREKRVIQANPEMYNYADSAYRANVPKIAGNRRGGILRRK